MGRCMGSHMGSLFGIAAWAAIYNGVAAVKDMVDATTSMPRNVQTATNNHEIATLFTSLARGATWNQTSSTHLNFQTYHPQGLAITPTRLFLSSVEILTATVPYPTPRNGLDRSPGSGIGHIFVLDHSGNLEKDIILTQDFKYHPGGIDYDGTNIWVPLAQYRPNSSASIYRIDAETLQVHHQFNASDHYGGIVYDASTKQLVGNNWGSRNFTAWTLDGKVIDSWANQDFFIDYQDCQYVRSGKAVCGGVANLPQNPAAVATIGVMNGTAPQYELGGIGLVDLKSHAIEHEIPVSMWSSIGHAVTRNPFKLTTGNGGLVMWVAPDDGTEEGGTDLLTFVTRV